MNTSEKINKTAEKETISNCERATKRTDFALPISRNSDELSSDFFHFSPPFFQTPFSVRSIKKKKIFFKIFSKFRQF